MVNLHLFCLFLLSSVSICFAVDPACGDWTAYKDEKCVKIFDKAGLVPFEDAEKVCKHEDSTGSLLSIKTKEEQDFFTDFIFTKSKVVDNVWIGARFEVNKFVWEDKSGLSFTNWVANHPKNLADYCVEMHSDPDSIGKWVDESCKRKNAIVCQKSQTWSIAKLQKTLLDTRKQHQDELDELKKNPVPIGFIYVQLPSKKSPQQIWPGLAWSDVSAAYSGVFFRVEGGDAAAFGTVQDDNAPRIVEIETSLNTPIKNRGESVGSDYKLSLTKGSKSKWFWTGDEAKERNDGINIQFTTSSGEVRPRNMAIRVWERTA